MVQITLAVVPILVMCARAGLVFGSELSSCELSLVDAPKQFYTSDRDSGRFEVLEAEHRPGSALDATMVLLTHQSGIKTTFLLYQSAGGAMTAG